jgi:hypothetical protein
MRLQLTESITLHHVIVQQPEILSDEVPILDPGDRRTLECRTVEWTIASLSFNS